MRRRRVRGTYENNRNLAAGVALEGCFVLARLLGPVWVIEVSSGAWHKTARSRLASALATSVSERRRGLVGVHTGHLFPGLGLKDAKTHDGGAEQEQSLDWQRC